MYWHIYATVNTRYNVCLRKKYVKHQDRITSRCMQHVLLLIIIRVFWMQDAVILFVQIINLSPIHTSNMSKQHVEFDMSKQRVECCFDMSNVAIKHSTYIRHVAVFGNMSNDFFILSTCRNKLNTFNFFRHVERTSNKLL